MRILQNHNLSKLNTFGVSVNAKLFIEINKEGDLTKLFGLPEFRNNKKIFLGGGSNILFTRDFDGIVVLNRLKGIEIKKTSALSAGEDAVFVRSMSGEFWNDLVNFAVNRGYWGIENLAFIPGTVGAAPMQNIGAYGTELKNTLQNIEAYEIATGAKIIFSREECGLGYRESIFKNELKDKYFISAVTLKLSKIPRPNLSYKILADYLEKHTRLSAQAGRGGNNIEIKSPKDISDAVISIRESKLPDLKILGNAGSFFKNVFVSKKQLDGLLKIFPDMPSFADEEEGEEGSKASFLVKIPAGWLIEQCGWKGRRIGNAGVHEKHALILVNYGGAKGKEIIDLANEIIKSVKEKFDLELLPEVNIV